MKKQNQYPVATEDYGKSSKIFMMKLWYTTMTTIWFL